MKHPVFQINNLNCQYLKSKRPVLEIDNLVIEQGTTTFFLGGSGVGKSTILESLGLMNNTIVHNKDSVLDFHYYDKEKKKEEKKCYFELWKKNEKVLSEFRRSHFNFIFQANNLFNSLDAYQNIMIPSLLAGVSEKAAKQRTIEILKNILPDIEINENKGINVLKLSGGQRQRISFARAIASGFDVLFADEPTGNLDYHNAHYIMDYLCDQKKDSDTVIVVSHDIDLAISKGDRIIFIDRMVDTTFSPEISWGKISKDSIFIKENDNKWLGPGNTNYKNESGISKMRDVLRERLKI